MPATAATMPPLIKFTGSVDDTDIRKCARVVFDHFGPVANLYALKKLKEAEAEGNAAAVAVWVRIAGVIQTFEGMHGSTAIH